MNNTTPSKRCHAERYSAKDLASNDTSRRCLGVAQHDKWPSLGLLVGAIVAFALTGCMSTPKNPIPHRGEVVAQGTGQLSFRAPDAGLVSVYDANTDSVVHSSAVARGSVVLVNPQAGNVSVTDADRAGTQIVNTGIDKSHRYEMWFIPITGGTYTATRSSQAPGIPQQQQQQQQP